MGKLLVNLGEKLTKEEAKNLMKELLTPPTMTASFPSSLSWRRCALPRSKRFTLSLLASTKSLHRRTSTFFGATDEPSRTIQEITGFIEIHSRDRGQKIACLVYLERKWWGGRGLRRTQAPTTPPTT